MFMREALCSCCCPQAKFEMSKNAIDKEEMEPMMKTDYDELQQLMATYAYSIDTRDYDSLAACFMADATTVYAGHSDVLTGHDQILAHMKRALDPLDVTQHLFTNFIIDIQGETGTLKCDILAQHVCRGERYLAGGKYNVEVRRSAGKWKIARVSARSVWSDGNRALLPKSE
jgi:ketosteroid isomerase-like protein